MPPILTLFAIRFAHRSILTGSGKTQWGGSNVVVIDSAELCKDPEKVLKAAMGKLGLPFSPAMLSWPSGPKPFDGCWSPQWYASTHASTGFVSPPKIYRTLPPLLLPLYRSALPFYTFLLTQAVPSKAFIDELYTDPRNANVLCFIGAR